MMTTEMLRKLERRQFDPPSVYGSCSKRLLRTDVSRIYELADEGHSTEAIAERVGLTKSSVSYRLANRGKALARGEKVKR